MDLLQTATDGLVGVACSHDHRADTRCDFRIERYDIAARDFDSLQLARVASFEVFSRLFLAVCVRLAVDISPPSTGPPQDLVELANFLRRNEEGHGAVGRGLTRTGMPVATID